ncbi:hypothetical protein AAFC00_003819 [Neodothiora populina]|uniref:Zn(2)-C6 fungal-type domain-containing protein n=1 Tax=Neodothiora populina TaxID=2781224 RepID=A0ABR3PFI9_9PEZI
MQRASCLDCHRRKLKCSREATGCSNCRKHDRPCEYPAAEARARGKRGPYQKRATKREGDFGQGHQASEAKYRELASCIDKPTLDSPRISVNCVTDDHASPHRYSSGIPDRPFNVMQNHPSFDQTLQLWRIFVERVDPLTKVIHRPSLQQKILTSRTSIHDIDSSLTTLMYSIYHAAVKSTSDAEAQRLFGASRDVLIGHFEAAVEQSLALVHMSNIPDFVMLQALVLYICTLRLQDRGRQLWPLFGLAVRMAQLLHMDGKEVEEGVSILEMELRRRIWWTLVWLEKLCAEDLMSQPASIMTWSRCPFPLNVNDDDLDAEARNHPHARNEVTEMTFCLLRFEMLKLFFDISKPRLDIAIDDIVQQGGIADQRVVVLSETRRRITDKYLQHCKSTRPFDWLVLTFAEVFLCKAELMAHRAVQSDNDVFRLSLIVVKNTYHIQTEPRAKVWSWAFRDFVQSHALMRVVSELCKGESLIVDSLAISEAWHFIEFIVKRIPSHRLRDPSIRPIVTLMGLAHKSQTGPAPQQPVRSSFPWRASDTNKGIAPSGNLESLKAFPDAWAESAITWGSNFLNAAITTLESANISDTSLSSPPDATIGIDGLSTHTFVWPAPDLVVNDTCDNIDWSHWDASMTVFNKAFAPGSA